MIKERRKIEAFSCHMNNLPEGVAEYQRKVFDFFEMEINQEISPHNTHHDWMNWKVKNTDFDIIIFFDIDCIPLKPGIYDHIFELVKDDNTIVGIEQANQDIDSNFVYAGPACFAFSRKTYEKLGRPTFDITKNYDVGGEFTWRARELGVRVELFKIKSSLNKKWKCGEKWFGNGTTYEDWLYHQFEVRFYPQVDTGIYSLTSEDKIRPFQFIQRCKKILGDI